jgi:hypothetical protein
VNLDKAVPSAFSVLHAIVRWYNFGTRTGSSVPRRQLWT